MLTISHFLLYLAEMIGQVLLAFKIRKQGIRMRERERVPK
jgi:hypothetical protein